MSLIHSGPSSKRIGFTLIALLLAASVQAQDVSTTPAAPQPVVPQASTLPADAPTPSAATQAAPAVTQPSPVLSPATAPAPVEAAPRAAAPQASGNTTSTPAPSSSAAPAGTVPAEVQVAPAEPLSPTSNLETAAPATPAPASTAPATDAAATIPHDLSPEGMFMAADWIVKSVMLSLAFASLVTWTVWVAKSLQLFGARARANRGLKAILKARHLKDALSVLENRPGVVASMVRAAQHEMLSSDAAIDRVGGDGVKERVASALGRIEARAGRQMSKGTGVLASIGSTAPFVGLFGTVWGIMNSFIGIAETQTTNLAVVAPGIAEALLATAIGLVAAIPAVIIYNVFARSVTGYRQLLADAGAGIERLVSRDLDYRKSALLATGGKDVRQAAE